MKTRVLTAVSMNPYRNLASEKLLFGTCGDEMILYLWRNENTVVIGRNQNCWKECALARMESDGVLLARRESGGGAVFHDSGNLNFTFISPKESHDVARQLGVIRAAAARFGVETELSGRNDILISANSCKFSGNAFQRGRTHSLHHGTILISADKEKAGRYLTPPELKLKAKGVSSVRSRICNLKEVASDISIDKAIGALSEEFEREYGRSESTWPFGADDRRLDEYENSFASREWIVGKTPSFNLALEKRFDWGSIEILLDVSRGKIAEASVYSDALNEDLIARLPSIFIDRPLRSGPIVDALGSLKASESDDLARWFAELSL